MMFIKTVKDFFSFLQSDYGCTVSYMEDRFQIKVVYQNLTTAVTISFEPRESRIYLMLTRLIEGEIPSYPIFIKPEIPLNIFYFDDLLNLRAPSSKIQQPDNPNEQDIKRILREYAEALKCYAVDILNGNFSVFLELEHIVKERAIQKTR